MQIILFSGKAESGKSTAALMVKNILELGGKKVLKIAYADLVKHVCKQYFGWNGQKDVTGRTILQYIGTDVVRAKNPNYWVDFVINFVKLFEDDYDYIEIDDARFTSEMTRWDRDGWDTFTVRVVREGYVSLLTPEQLLHQSECALDNYNFDYYIKAKDMYELSEEVNKFIEYMEVN